MRKNRANYWKKYYRANRSKETARKKRFREANPEKVRDQSRASYYKNRNSILRRRADIGEAEKAKRRKYHKKYKLLHPEKFPPKLTTKYRHASLDAYRTQRRRYMKFKNEADPCFKMASNLRSRISRAIREGKGQKSIKSIELLGCSLEEARLHLEKLFKPGMSWKNWGRKGWHVDHIKPCKSFDLSRLSEQKKCFRYTNLQPLWWAENLAKGHTQN
jgi:hypothetical protein